MKKTTNKNVKDIKKNKKIDIDKIKVLTITLVIAIILVVISTINVHNTNRKKFIEMSKKIYSTIEDTILKYDEKNGKKFDNGRFTIKTNKILYKSEIISIDNDNYLIDSGHFKIVDNKIVSACIIINNKLIGLDNDNYDERISCEDSSIPEIISLDAVNITYNTITVKANFKEENLKEILFSIDGKDYVSNGVNPEMTYKNLDKNTEYKISYKVINKQDYLNESKTFNFRTKDIEEVSVRYNRNDWMSNKDIYLDFGNIKNDLEYGYKVNNNNIVYTNNRHINLNYNDNGTLSVFVNDKSNPKNNLSDTYYIKNIDNVVPEITPIVQQLTWIAKEKKDTRDLFDVLFGISNGTVKCNFNNLEQLRAGKHFITCEAISNNKLNSSAELEVNVIDETAPTNLELIVKNNEFNALELETKYVENESYAKKVELYYNNEWHNVENDKILINKLNKNTEYLFKLKVTNSFDLVTETDDIKIKTTDINEPIITCVNDDKDIWKNSKTIKVSLNNDDSTLKLYMNDELIENNSVITIDAVNISKQGGTIKIVEIIDNVESTINILETVYNVEKIDINKPDAIVKMDYVDGAQNWYTKDIKVEINSVDNESGIEKIVTKYIDKDLDKDEEVIINEYTDITSDKIVDILNVNSNNLTYKVLIYDKAGNINEIVYENLKMLNKDTAAQKISEDTIILEISEVNKCEYQKYIKDSNKFNYSVIGDKEVKNLPIGEHNISLNVIHESGLNIFVSLNIKIVDTIKPEVTYEIIGEKLNEEYLMPTVIKVNATDTGTGIKSIKWYNDDILTDTIGDTFTTEEKEYNNLKVEVTDNASNVTITTIEKFKVTNNE